MPRRHICLPEYQMERTGVARGRSQLSVDFEQRWEETPLVKVAEYETEQCGVRQP